MQTQHVPAIRPRAASTSAVKGETNVTGATLSVDRQRWFDRRIGAPICWLLTQLHRLNGPGVVPTDIRRILIIVLSEMGALVLARPMFERLRNKYKDASLFVLCFDQNRAALELLDVVASDHVIGLRNDSLAHLLSDSAHAIRQIRRMQPDVVLDLELFARASAIYAGLSGAPIRVGFHRHTQEGLYRGDFINRPVMYNPHHHIADQFMTLAEAIDSTTVPKAKRLVPSGTAVTYQMPLRPGELDAARRDLYSRFPALANRTIVFLAPGAGLLPIRAWPVSHFVELARQLETRGLAVAVVGLPEDRSLAQTILAGRSSEASVDLTGYTRSVRELTVLFHFGGLLITNDGGSAHFASLSPIPTIVLFGPETPAIYGSLSEHAVNLHTPLSCSPCLTAANHRRSPCDGDNICLKLIAPGDVLAAADRLLARAPRSSDLNKSG
jgi:ADP-heptose:LPS heptosyltransferase